MALSESQVKTASLYSLFTLAFIGIIISIVGDAMFVS